MIIISSIYSYSVEKSLALAKLRKEAVFLKNITINTIASYVWNINKNEINDLSEIILEKDIISGLQIIDEKDDLFYAMKKVPFGTVSYELPDAEFIPPQYYFKIEQDLKNGDESFGHVIYYITDEKIYPAVRIALLKKIGEILLIVTGTLIIVLFGFNKTVIHPITDLNNTVNMFGLNNYSERSNITLKNEIGELARTFNFMADTIQENYEDLEKMINDRTKQLLHAEKMASLGELVAGVSHEINTPVGIGVTAITHLEKKTNDFIKLFNEEKAKKTDLDTFLNEISDTVVLISTNLNRAAQLVQSFKRVAVDRSTEEKRRFHVKNYFEEIMLSLRPKYKKTKHKIQIDIPMELEINSYPGSFSQIISNLVINSLIHGFENIEEGQITLSAKVVNENFIFEYEDNGNGISEENITKIFNPFFTTKRNQGGSGLGLNIIYNIVKQNLNGSIDVQSEPGKFTRFTITIPYEA